MIETSMLVFLYKNGDLEILEINSKRPKLVAPVPLLFDNVLEENNIANHWEQDFVAIYQDAACSSSIVGMHIAIDVGEQIDGMSAHELESFLNTWTERGKA